MNKTICKECICWERKAIKDSMGEPLPASYGLCKKGPEVFIKDEDDYCFEGEAHEH